VIYVYFKHKSTQCQMHRLQLVTVTLLVSHFVYKKVDEVSSLGSCQYFIH